MNEQYWEDVLIIAERARDYALAQLLKARLAEEVMLPFDV